MPPLKSGNYLTIGAFHIKENAINFKNYINRQGIYEAEVGYLPSTNFNYVYVKTYEDPKDGYPDVWNFRKNTPFDDTWVFSTRNGTSGLRDNIHARNGYKFYLTVGTFAIRQNALDFLDYVESQGAFDPHVIYSPYTEYFYVYVTTYPSFPEGSPNVFKMRRDTEYYDTWLFSFHGDELVPEGIVTGSMKAANGSTNIDFALISKFKSLRENEGQSDEQIRRDHRNEKDVDLNILLSYLNSNGKTIEALKDHLSGQKVNPRAIVIAKIIASARKKYPQLTDAHEDEMFDFLMNGKGKQFTNPYVFMDFISKRIENDPDWTPSQELNLDDLLAQNNKLNQNSNIALNAIDLTLLEKFKNLRENEGQSDSQIIENHQDVENVDYNVLLSYLNLEGRTLDSLNKSLNSGVESSRMTKIGEMVSTARKTFPILTDKHEDEMFDFLASGLGQFINDTNDFVRLVEIAISLKDWHRELPLDLAKALLEGKFTLADPVADSVLKANAKLIKVDVVPPTYEEDGKYQMFFNSYYSKTGDKIEGAIQVIDPVRLKQMSIEKSLEVVWIPDPNNQTESIEVIADIFGYKKVQHDFRMSEPFDSLSANFLNFKGDVLMVDFPLQRYDVGDIATMYNVYYFKDAAVMRPESQFEINALQEMLEENPDLKIKIHGHTNGKAPGKIIRVAEGTENYFSLDNVDEGFGSSKQLSEERANVIKTYLINAGISPDRMEVKGWGGKKPIYDKFDPRALKNVRVEIEILEN